MSPWMPWRAADGDVRGGPLRHSNMFVYVSFHIYKDVAEISSPLTLDRAFS